MKFLFMKLLSLMLVFTACNDSSKTDNSSSGKTDSSSSKTSHSKEDNKSGSADPVIAAYLNIKNALADDNGKDAAAAAAKKKAAK